MERKGKEALHRVGHRGKGRKGKGQQKSGQR